MINTLDVRLLPDTVCWDYILIIATTRTSPAFHPASFLHPNTTTIQEGIRSKVNAFYSTPFSRLERRRIMSSTLGVMTHDRCTSLHC